MKNKIVVAVAAVLVGFGLYQWSESEAIEPAVTLALEAEPSPAGSDTRAMTETLEPAKGPDLAGERLSVGGTPVEGVDEPSTGWWLVGFVSGIPEGEHASTSLRITGSRGSGWAKHVISAGVQPDGSVRVDLQEIFRSERVLPSELIARVSHPGLRPAEQKWLLGRQERQAGFLPGEFVLFELDRELSPAPGGVRGVVTLPVGYEPEDVLISLIPVLEDGPDTCASVSQERCDAAGEFRLGFDQPGRYHLLATHKKRRLRPRFIDLELTEGQVELDQPLELDEGAVLEGAVTLNSAVPNFDLDLGVSEKVFVSRPYCPTLPHTFWIDGSYQYNSVSCRTADAGRIRITGMVPGVYKLRVNSVLIDGEWVRLGSLGRGVRAIREVEFPNSIAVIDFGFQIQLFRTVTGGEPLPYVRVQARTRNSSSTTNTGAKGQFAQAYVVDSSSEPPLRLDFSEEGYEKRSVPIVGGAQTLDWQEVEMSPTVTGEATLVLSLLGDPDRSMERFSLFLLREGEQYGSSNLLSWQKTQWKRGNGPVRIDGIEAGAYRLTFKADSPSNPSQMYWPDTASAILNEEFEIEFSPGERRELSLRLRDGGRLFLPAICPGGDCGDRTGSLHFRIKAGGGESIKASWVTAADSGKRHRTIGTLNLRLDSFLEPPLEPGDYELEVWCLEEEVDLVAHPFRILAGEITRMDLDDPR